MREQRAYHAPPIRRQPDVTTNAAVDDGPYDDISPVRIPSSAKRYQGVEGAQGNGSPGKGNSLIPPRHSLHEQPNVRPPIHMIRGEPHVNIGGQWVQIVMHEGAPPPARKQKPSQGQPQQRDTDQYSQQSLQPHSHRLVFVGIAMLFMLVGWLLVTMFLQWWQITQDDWHYGRPRTYQVDQKVGHGDTIIPSHFIAMNLAHRVQVVECPAGDCTRAIVYLGAQIIGNGDDLAVVTLTFKDVKGDGKLDMLVHVSDQTYVFINDNGRFRPARPGENMNV